MSDDLDGFYMVNADGYLTLEFFPDPEDEHCGELVCFVEAGDTLTELIEKAQKFKQDKEKVP